MTLPQNVLGVDVAGDWIDIHDLENSHDQRLETTPRALTAWARDLARGAGVLVVFEASGGCERPLMAALEGAGVAYARVNPRQAREFARACGQLAKTDRVDARILARMGRALELAPTPPTDPARRRLAELVARRATLVDAVTKEDQRLRRVADAFVRADIKAVLAMLKRRKIALEAEIARCMRDHDHLHVLEQRMRTAPGVGPTVAAVLVARMEELGRLDRRALASLAGLAPHACDSGHMRGKRRIWGGRGEVRRALYIAAFIASRCDPGFRLQRDVMTKAGKPLKVILIALARRLLVILNAMIREERNYAPMAKA